LLNDDIDDKDLPPLVVVVLKKLVVVSVEDNMSSLCLYRANETE
jgi:hypothetical protein